MNNCTIIFFIAIYFRSLLYHYRHDHLLLYLCRTATKAQINRAYRDLAIKWHPDKHEGEDKKVAEKKFYDIAAAKEVLSDHGKYISWEKEKEGEA